MSEITLRLNEIEVRAPFASKILKLSVVDDVLFQFSLDDSLCRSINDTTCVVGKEGLTEIVKISESVLYFEQEGQEEY